MENRYKGWITQFIFSLFILIPSVLYAQGNIKGTVTDEETGEPIAGVNIVISGTQTGTSTDAEGEYELKDISAGTYNVEARYVGYETVVKSVTVRNNQTSTLNFEFSLSTTMLDDVVVTALGISREQRSIGYSTQVVDGENLTMAGEKNVIGSLAGKIAGVQVTGASGASMGGTQKIKIRGVNSISGSGEPLIVIDGTPISNANFSGSVGRDYGNIAQDINPDDIESVNVLKGPAASALYGIRGQYGVIMITTAKGAQGADRFTVELNSSVSIDKVSNIMPYQNLYGAGSSQTWNTLPNGDKYVDMIDESWGPKMDGTPVRQFYSFFPEDKDYGKTTPFVPHPDNIKDYFETGSTFSNGLTVSGGTNRASFRLSFNNTNTTGIEPNTFLDRSNVGVSTGIQVSDQWKFNADVNFSTNKGRRPTQGAEAGSRYFGQWFERNIDMNRMRDYKYPDGSFLHWNLRTPSSVDGEIANLRPLYFDNPFFMAYESFGDDSRDRLFGNMGLTYTPIEGLELSAFVRSDMYTQNIESRSAFGGSGTPGYSVGKYQNTEMNYELMARYNKRWDEFTLNGTLGGNVYDRHYTYVSESTVGGLSTPGFYNIDASIDRPNTTSYLLNKKIMSGYGLLSLGYKDVYYLDVSLRNDKSSALPKDNNSYWYYSVSGSFVFGDLIDWEPLSFGKLRLSYAKAGSDLSPYQTTPVYVVGTNYGSTSSLALPSTLNNPSIKPSFSHSYEAGIDLRLFDRLGLELTYYMQQNKDQIISLDISGTSGYGATNINAGLIENKGIEISLTGTPIQTRDFNWDAGFNISKNIGEVVELHPSINVYQYDYTVYSSVTTYLNSYEGEPFGSIVGQAYQRDEATGKILLDDNNIPMYTDATHNFGSALPDWTGGFHNTLNYKDFSLSAMIDFQIGGQFFSRSQSLADRTGLSEKTAATNDKGHNVRDDVSAGGGVKVNGISNSTGQEVTAYVPAKTYYGILGQRIAEEYIYDASYVKLREVRFGYNVNSKLIEKLPVQNIRVGLIARNPLTIWQDAPKGLDPSELSTGSQSISWYEAGMLNSVRSYGFDINITF